MPGDVRARGLADAWLSDRQDPMPDRDQNPGRARGCAVAVDRWAAPKTRHRRRPTGGGL